MRKLFFVFVALAAFVINASAQNYPEIVPDTAKVRYVRNSKPEDAYIFDKNISSKKTIFVNEEITTHIIMPECIKMVDISTQNVVGNQCAENIVRIKPAGRMYDRELVGTITVIGERHIAQYKVVYIKNPIKAHSVYYIEQEDMQEYTNPEISMSLGEMARYAAAIQSTGRTYNNITAKKYGMKAVVNNIYSIGDYFFIDFSLYNKTKIKYEIDDIRVKLMDKKETKSTNSQTIELIPVYASNNARSFKRAYRNVVVLKKLTFPDEKVLKIEVSENQISGRVITIPIEYTDILTADGIDDRLTRVLPRY